MNLSTTLLLLAFIVGSPSNRVDAGITGAIREIVELYGTCNSRLPMVPGQ
jgi:hypothetical protein